MSELLTRTFLTALISGGLIAGVSLMFTALGETISERAGVLNIGLEGMMLVGAYIGFVGAYYGHSFWVGFAAGIAGGAFASLFMVVLCVRLGLDQIVVGIAITVPRVRSRRHSMRRASASSRRGVTPLSAPAHSPGSAGRTCRSWVPARSRRS